MTKKKTPDCMVHQGKPKPARYVWKGFYGAETPLCAEHTAEWREQAKGPGKIPPYSVRSV